MADVLINRTKIILIDRQKNTYVHIKNLLNKTKIQRRKVCLRLCVCV